MLRDRIDEAITRRLLPEISIDASALDSFDRKEAEQMAEKLRNHGIESTIHGPFWDLNPGAIDPKIRDVTRERIDHTLDAASVFGASCVVFHPGYDPRSFQGCFKDLWLKYSVETWKPVVDRAEQKGITVALENVYEKTPETLLSLFEQIQSVRFRHCLDVGHLNIFADTPMEEWVKATAHLITEFHLHDNGKKNDDHLPLGKGEIDLPLFSRLIRHYVKGQVFYTLEPAREEDIEDCIQGFLRFMDHPRGSLA
jgi:sugar phosphate isomerase/epimerase